ncbi:unnamed protein product [Cyclocybe aegerita]|uniref:E3 SUMO-protein ligase pli1 n=1 Tax=Cyclocybe aegerita TaxID=1973307 RepID=A0A8S0XJS5_CYCAE|nr:unnamed protein product [Cyclocybe aegerita]
MSSDAWADFETLRHGIRNNTVDRLKQILAGFNDECGTHFAKSGKKQDLIDRIVVNMDQWQANSAEDKWLKAKAVIYQVRNTGTYTHSHRIPALTAPIPTSTSHSTYDPPKASSFATTPYYDVYAPPRRPGTSAQAPSASTSSAKPQIIRFKESPFFMVDQIVSQVMECPESTSATDRRSQNINWNMSSDVMEKLKAPGNKYQLRLFSTSSIFFAGTNTFRTNLLPCPIEFPPTCEVRVNNVQITANLKGLKKKPGTAPPPDITKLCRITGSNRVEMVYVNSQQPVQSKKYYIVVILVETTTIDALVENLKTQHRRSAQDIQQKMRQALSDDDDIIAGPQKMSLKCPLTFVRISTPCRSFKCVHPQCFDATSWFTMMEQTTTWLCPVCERILDHRDLILDGYFEEILQQTPESVEDVMVEADGQWHTTDNKYGSAEWKAAHTPPVPVRKAPPEPEIASRVAATLNGTGQTNGKGKAPDVEIFVLDSDEDEEEGRVKRELSPSYASSARESFDGHLPGTRSDSQSISGQVIDLTLDSSDEDDQPVSANVYGKRKAADAELDSIAVAEPIWKKGKIDPSSRILPAPRGGLGVAPLQLHTPPLSSGTPTSGPLGSRYTSSFQNNTLPPPTAFYSRGGPPNASLQLPPLPTTFTPRSASQNPRWPA